MAREAPAGPRAIPLLGHAHRFFRNPIDFPVACQERYGDLVRLRLAGSDTLLLGHPDYVKHVLVENVDNYRKGELYREELGFLGNGLLVSEGEKWTRQRQQLAPMFQPGAIGHHEEMMWAAGGRAADRLPVGKPVNIDEHLQELSLEIIANAMLGVDITERVPAIRQSLADVMAAARASSRVPISPPDWMPTPSNRRYRRALSQFDDVVSEIIEERRVESDDPTDLVTHLIAIQESSPDTITDEEIRDQILTMLLAGHDTTALGMAYTLHLLARHPVEQTAVVDDLGTNDDPTANERLEWAIKEALRLYPPSYLFLREAIGADEVDGVSIHPGTIMVIHPWLIHRDSRFFDRPTAFDPSRWAGGLESDLHPFAYFPFSGGRRRCIGGHFAMLEMRSVLPTLLGRYRFEPVSDEPIDLKPRITLRPKSGIGLIARPR